MNQTSNRGIGLMCGTSLDGLDICDVEFSEKEGSWNFTVHGNKSNSLPDELKSRIANATDSSALELVKIDRDFALFVSDSISKFIEESSSLATFIASHGVTIFHQPENGFTTQLGSGAIISAKTGLLTVSDFRLQDVAKKGQGAPLVPFSDSMLFKQYNNTLNLGGFANISQLGENCFGFDVGVCNMLLNFLSQKDGLDFDSGGEKARNGNLITELLEALNELEYFRRSGPKSLGKEWFQDEVMPIINSVGSFSNDDILRTSVEHIAQQIGLVLNNENHTCLVTGGGAFNDFLIDRISYFSKSKIVVPSSQIIEYKEAISFAFLGLLRIQGKQNISMFTTGATQNSCSGAIYLP